MMKNTDNILGERLLAVSKYIRKDAVLCDVGTDHAKLPIKLVLDKRIERAYATDINEGPIKTAEKNVKELGLSDMIGCIMTDGLVKTDGLGITDVSICGMGGELIARILSECSYIKDPKINLVLQPMTHAQDLRRFLFKSGFDIKDERLCKESGKLYLVINASYSGKTVEFSELELYIGKILPLKQKDALFYELCERTLCLFENKQKSSDKQEAEMFSALFGSLKEMITE
jgi:tRNA (adenine22-N1)-methyltransferase